MTGTAFTVACVGAGYFAQLHHAAWQEIAGAALVGVADPDPIATSPKHVQRYDSLDAMLAAGPVDILDIVTPPASHAALIEQPDTINHRLERFIRERTGLSW